jgi:iron-sulfur cluster assembly protein
MSEIINITEKAKKQISNILRNAPKDSKGIIIGVDNTGCSGHSYKLDFFTQSDTNNYECINKDGVKIFIDPKAVIYLIGTTMDFQTDKLSSKFVFSNPNSKNVCGCGDSFSI